MTTATPTASPTKGKEPATPAKNEPDVGTFHAERARQHREYVARCIQLADKAVRVLQPHLGRDAKLSVQSLRPSPGQRLVTPNGVLQENGLVVFGYAVDFEAPQVPSHVVHFFLSVGKIAGEKGKPDDWYIGHNTANFSMPNGGTDQELEPLFAHIVKALEAEIVTAYPTDARQEKKARDDTPPKDKPKEAV